jgi:hypothetical protein
MGRLLKISTENGQVLLHAYGPIDTAWLSPLLQLKWHQSPSQILLDIDG